MPLAYEPGETSGTTAAQRSAEKRRRRQEAARRQEAERRRRAQAAARAAESRIGGAVASTVGAVGEAVTGRQGTLRQVRRKSEAQVRREAERKLRQIERQHAGQFGPTSAGAVTPAQARKRGAAARLQEGLTRQFMETITPANEIATVVRADAARQRETERQLRSFRSRIAGRVEPQEANAGVVRPEMPGAELRTPEARQWAARMATENEGLGAEILNATLALGKTAEGVIDVVTGVPTFIKDPTFGNAAWAAFGVLPVGWVVAGSRSSLRVARALGRLTRDYELPVRTFRTGELASEIPGAGSRTGRLIENVYDSLRSEASVAKVATAELLRSATIRAKVKLGSADALGRVGRKLNAEEQVALRLMAENAPLENQLASFAQAAANAERTDTRIYLGIHQRLIQQARRYVEDAADGVQFTADAPRQLRTAWEILNSVATSREEIYKVLGRLTDERIAYRINAPGRKVMGAKRVTETLAERYARYSEYGREFLIGSKVRPMDRKNLGTVTEIDEAGQMARVHFMSKRAGEEADAWFPLNELNVASGKGKLVGAEGFARGRVYVQDVRGVPGFGGRGVSMRTLARQSQAFISGGWRRSITAAGRDTSLTNAWTGMLRDTGFLRTDVTNISAQSLAKAVRFDSIRYIRDGLLQAAEDVPRGLDWVPIKVFPERNAPEGLKRYWDKWEQLEAGGFTEDTLQRLFGSDSEIQGLLDELFPKNIINTGEAIPGIKWVRPEMMDELAAVNPLAWKLNIITPRGGVVARAGMKALVGSLDAYNDLQRAAILYLNPAYGPVNLLGNVAMNVMQQGVLLPRNIVRAANIAQELSPEGIATARKLIGRGLTRSLDLRTVGVRSVTGKVGRVISMLSDSGPRWTAFVHEASKAGYKTAAELDALFRAGRAGDEASLKRIEYITRKANDAIVDYERLSPFERNIVTRVVFFYPWLKGAARWTKRFPLEHPVQTAGLAAGAVAEQQYANEQLGPRPWYAQFEIPIPGMSDAAGNPYVFNPRQILTPVTPLEALWAGSSLVTGSRNAPQVIGQLTPGVENIIAALTGRDQYGRDVGPGIGTFLRESYRNLPPTRFARAFTEPRPDEQSLYPRTRRDEFVRLGIGGLAPKPYNVQLGQERVAGEQAGEPEIPAYAKLYQWASDPANLPEGAPPTFRADLDTWKQGQDLYRFGRVTLARQLGLKNKDGSPHVSGLSAQQETAIKLGILERIRPDYLPPNARDLTRRAFESGDEDWIRSVTEAINRGLAFGDRYGRSLETLIKEFRGSEMKAKTLDVEVNAG